MDFFDKRRYKFQEELFCFKKNNLLPTSAFNLFFVKKGLLYSGKIMDLKYEMQLCY
jgi:hypothetical protein